ncbi:hypothetical protein [Macrococcus armenti]|uniref:hypothetical protein n=1 Tax=Macrococcus armenti TaxID=2875764 RepID=UPI001CCB04CF|nr:hypothetical protein [Macrococcus armenti]UBH16630.1 hypothetical protein LAU44_12010 [Macrococcus armenti]UBH21264.1 hypothetical protein LAU40_12045 [Macrococcus armenti]
MENKRMIRILVPAVIMLIAGIYFFTNFEIKKLEKELNIAKSELKKEKSEKAITHENFSNAHISNNDVNLNDIYEFNKLFINSLYGNSDYDMRKKTMINSTQGQARKYLEDMKFIVSDEEFKKQIAVIRDEQVISMSGVEENDRKNPPKKIQETNDKKNNITKIDVTKSQSYINKLSDGNYEGVTIFKIKVETDYKAEETNYIMKANYSIQNGKTVIDKIYTICPFENEKSNDLLPE